MDQNKANKISLIFLSIFLLIGTLLAGLRSLTIFLTNIQWFKLNNYLNTFLVKIKTEILIIIPLFLVISFGLYFYLKMLKNKYYHTAHIFYNAKADKNIHIGMRIISIFLAGAVSFIISNNLWLNIKLYLNSQSFGLKDPIFSKDVSFYVFKLPLYEEILTTLILLTLILAIITISFFFFIISIRQTAENKVQDIHYINNQQKVKSFFSNEVVQSVIKKIAVLGMIVLFLVSFRYYLRGYELMYSTRGVVYGASYTDIKVTLIVYRLLSFFSLVGGIVFFFALNKKMKKLTIVVPVILILIGVGGGITASIVQQLVVEPDEISKENKYLEYNIEYTQKAFNLDNVTTEEFKAEQNLTWDDILNNETTISNIRINDQRPLKQTYNQIQGIRLYYEFSDIDLDRYQIGDEYMQTFISAREMNQENLSDQAKTWINEHLKYTHGYGIVMSPVNSVTNEGQPELMIQNIPPISTSSLTVSRPEIYFGELTNNYVIINTDEDEFDYPSGSDNETTRYEGTAGIEMTGMNRVLFAIRERSMKLLVSSVINTDSRILMYRNIKERASTIAPFLTYDENPYLVLNQLDGKLYWILDAYTTSRFYPYSEVHTFKTQPVNYIRNSVKVVVDAYEGTTSFYIVDEEDPMVKVYDDIFDDLFMSIDDFPEGLLSHIKYPQDFFELQSRVFTKYHVENPEVFYNGEDIWDIANEKYMENTDVIQSSYVMFKLSDSEAEEFALIIPYTPKEKANMTSLFVARNDGDNYGKLYVYKFPKDKTIQGPMMIESRIDQDSDISPQFTLWSQEGSSVLRGNLIVVPVENSILYIEPIYIQADNPNSLPEMKRVIVAYGEKIAMEETLDAALRKIFNQSSLPIDYDPDGLSPELVDILNQLNDLLQNQQDNNEDLQNIINQLNSIINNK
jgi:uncharacterized membrane protein (UPF0182 family)